VPSDFCFRHRLYLLPYLQTDTETALRLFRRRLRLTLSSSMCCCRVRISAVLDDTQAEAVWWRTMSRGSEPVSSSSAERYLPLKPTRRPPPCHLYHPASLSMSRTATPKHTHTHNLTSFDRKMFTNLCFKKKYTASNFYGRLVALSEK